MQSRLRLTSLALSAALAGASGCGDGMPIVPVSGQITFNGEPCPRPGAITFIPVETSGEWPNRQGSARFGLDGVFEVTSFQVGDGLLPGKYRVSISCMKEPDLTTPRSELDYVPAGYRPDDLVVEQGQGAIELTYDVPNKNK